MDIDKNDGGWGDIAKPYLSAPSFLSLKAFLLEQENQGKIIYPPKDKIFNAFHQTPFDDVKIVILGQDPYHGVGQAHGLSFSVPKDIKVPPSLKNIYKELVRDFKEDIPKDGDLTHWANQGVLLLNAVLTVENGKAAAHQNRGWEEFTDGIIRTLTIQKTNLVFMLWGAYAQKKGVLIDQNKHLVLTAVHPSPLSAHRGFIGCGHFSKANAYLELNGKKPVKWI